MVKSKKQALSKRLDELKNNTLEFEEEMNTLKNNLETKDKDIESRAENLKGDFEAAKEEAEKRWLGSEYDYDGFLKSLDGIIADYEENKKHKKINSRIDDINKKTEDLKTSLDVLENKKEKTESEELESSIKKLNDDLNKLKKRHNNLSALIDKLYADTVAKIGKINEENTKIYDEIVNNDNIDKDAEIPKIMTKIGIIKKVREIRNALTDLERKSMALLKANGRKPKKITDLLKDNKQPTDLDKIRITIGNLARFYGKIELPKTKIGDVDITSCTSDEEIKEKLEQATNAEFRSVQSDLACIPNLLSTEVAVFEDRKPEEIEKILGELLENINKSIKEAEEYCKKRDERTAQKRNNTKTDDDIYILPSARKVLGTKKEEQKVQQPVAAAEEFAPPQEEPITEEIIEEELAPAEEESIAEQPIEETAEEPTEEEPIEEEIIEEEFAPAEEEPIAEEPIEEEIIEEEPIESVEETTEPNLVEKDEQTEQTVEMTSDKSGIYEQAWAKELVETVAAGLAKLPSKEVVNTMRTIVQNIFDEEDLARLENAEPDEYIAIVQNKINSLSGNSEFIEAKRAESFAAIRVLIEDGKVPANEETYSNILNIVNSLDKDEIDYKKTGNLYSYYRKRLPKKQLDEITALITTSDRNIDQAKLSELLKRKGRYLTPLLNKKENKEMRKTLLKLIISDYDKEYGTNYLADIDKIMEKLLKNENQKARNEALKKLNFQVPLW